MHKVFFASPARFLAVLLAISATAAVIGAQAANPAAPAAAPVQGSTAAETNNELLAKAVKLYYSTDKAGLAGFDCAVHPDWHALFVSDGNSAIDAADPRIVLLNAVSIAFHARMKGGSGVDWNPPAHPGQPLDKESANLLDKMQAGTAQTLQGFMQFWTPFVDGSIIPDSSDGVEITPTGKGGYTLHADQEGTALTEILDGGLVLQQFNVAMNGMTVDFSPLYKSTEKGLLVTSFVAHIVPAGAATGQADEMHVSIEYQAIDGFPIPAKLNMEELNHGIFNFVLDGCKVARQAR
jgi:hypothetical protein